MTDLESRVERLEQKVGIDKPSSPRVELRDNGALAKTVRVEDIERIEPNDGTHPMAVWVDGTRWFVSEIVEAAADA